MSPYLDKQKAQLYKWLEYSIFMILVRFWWYNRTNWRKKHKPARESEAIYVRYKVDVLILPYEKDFTDDNIGALVLHDTRSRTILYDCHDPRTIQSGSPAWGYEKAGASARKHGSSTGNGIGSFRGGWNCRCPQEDMDRPLSQRVLSAASHPNHFPLWLS